MAIRYCFKCASIVDDRIAIEYESSFFCPTCKKSLHYFGREPVQLSAESIEATKHSIDPLIDFQNRLQNYQNNPMNLDELECMEILKHNAHNHDALLYLAKRRLSDGALDHTETYIKKILNHDPENIDALQIQGKVEMMKRSFSNAIVIFEQIKRIVHSSVNDTHNHRAATDASLDLSICHYFMNNHTLALNELSELISNDLDDRQKEKILRLKDQIVISKQ